MFCSKECSHGGSTQKQFGFQNQMKRFVDTLNNCQGDLQIVRKQQGLCPHVLLFSQVNKLFLGYFDPKKIFIDNDNKYFLG